VRQARQSCESGQSEFFDVEHRFLLPGEAVLWVQTSGRVVARDPQGQARRMLGSVINVSSRREQMDKLAQTKALAETASLAKSHFLANMSHEIRTPMNGIMGMTALCLQTELTATQRSYLDMVERSAQSLLAVINDILDLSKIEAHRLELDPQPFSPRELLLQTARTLSLHAAEKRIDLILDTAPDLPATALGDPIRLQQVLTNLLSNAIKFTQRGEVLVRAVRLQPPDAAPEDFWLEVSVHDTGIGIPADKHAAIFDAFTQADVSTARRFGGTGLGLAISRSLVNLMGGDIRVISHDGAGSTFCFTACLRAESPEPTPLPPMPECSAPQQVLVIDDNASQRAVLHRMLRRLGWTPLVCSRIEDALARTQTEPITLALVDLPSTTGDLRALLAPLRQRWPARQLPLALMGTLGQQPTDTVLAQAEAQVFLLKPLDLHALVQGLQPWCWPGQNPLLPTATAPVVALPPSPPEAIEAWRDDATPLRVLLVEDTPINQKLALILLERMGCAATLACNGIEAVSQFQTQPFDLILMDIQMPEMGGIEATAHIRAHEARTHQTRTPIIALTANALQGARERYLQADMDGYVTKPISVLALQAEIRRLMAQPRATTDHAQN
jgi:signal transduction histidine kinase/DNA-binding response OmpR family regulator